MEATIPPHRSEPSDESSSESSESESESETSVSSDSDIGTSEKHEQLRKEVDEMTEQTNEVITDLFGPRTQNEVIPSKVELSALPDTPLSDKDEIEIAGKILSTQRRLNSVVVQAQGVDPEAPVKALDQDSLLCTKEKEFVGRIEDVFGPVVSPFYLVRLMGSFKWKESEEQELEAGTQLYVAKKFGKTVNTAELNTKGSDASNLYNEEPPEQELEFSDDEAESRAKQERKKKSGGFHLGSTTAKPVGKRTRQRPNRNKNLGPRPAATQAPMFGNSHGGASYQQQGFRQPPPPPLVPPQNFRPQYVSQQQYAPQQQYAHPQQYQQPQHYVPQQQSPTHHHQYSSASQGQYHYPGSGFYASQHHGNARPNPFIMQQGNTTFQHNSNNRFPQAYPGLGPSNTGVTNPALGHPNQGQYSASSQPNQSQQSNLKPPGVD